MQRRARSVDALAEKMGKTGFNGLGRGGAEQGATRERCVAVKLKAVALNPNH